MWKTSDAPIRKKILALCYQVTPICIGGFLLCLYNYLRFNNYLEFGVSYQLTSVDPLKIDLFGLNPVIHGTRWTFHVTQYLISAPIFQSKFPFIRLDRAKIPGEDTIINLNSEEVGGMLLLFPYLILAMIRFPYIFFQAKGLITLYISTLFAAGIVLFLVLCTNIWIVARYQLEFLQIFSVASLLTLASHHQSKRRLVWIWLSSICFIYSIGVGILLGFSGNWNDFYHRNPELFRTIVSLIHNN